MTISVGFVLVTHNHVDQTAFLCRRLNDMFDHPPIAIHHDFGQTSMNVSDFSHNVHVVEDWIETSWASVEVVDANLKALRLLYQKANPDWVISLSNACYPIKTAEAIIAALTAADGDAFIGYRRSPTIWRESAWTPTVWTPSRAGPQNVLSVPSRCGCPGDLRNCFGTKVERLT